VRPNPLALAGPSPSQTRNRVRSTRPVKPPREGGHPTWTQRRRPCRPSIDVCCPATKPGLRTARSGCFRSSSASDPRRGSGCRSGTERSGPQVGRVARAVASRAAHSVPGNGSASGNICSSRSSRLRMMSSIIARGIPQGRTWRWSRSSWSDAWVMATSSQVSPTLHGTPVCLSASARRRRRQKSCCDRASISCTLHRSPSGVPPQPVGYAGEKFNCRGIGVNSRSCSRMSHAPTLCGGASRREWITVDRCIWLQSVPMRRVEHCYCQGDRTRLVPRCAISTAVCDRPRPSCM
jgi:hypothetical protein